MNLPSLLIVAFCGYAAVLYLLHLYTGPGRDRETLGSLAPSDSATMARLFAISLIGLFLEMLMIRWISSEIRIFAYFKNFVLIACFLGFGLGAAISKRRVHLIATAGPMLLFALLLALPGLHDAVVGLTGLIGATSQQMHIWGTEKPNQQEFEWLLAAMIAVAPLFALVVFSFVPIGQMVGSMLERAVQGVKAYSVNVLGSLCGILLYTFLCFLYQPPAIWFAVLGALFAFFFWRRWAALVIMFGSCAACAALLMLPPTGPARTYWSPYQKLTLVPVATEEGDLLSYSLLTNDSWYQQILNLSPEFIKAHPQYFEGYDVSWSPYNAPYHFAKAPQSVLVLGAGTGNDVAGVLRNTSAQVTAVEIDPFILELGKRLHFEHPYASPRVTIVNDDARAFIQNSHAKFDLILFSLLDSHTTASSYSNVRIDNYVYTVEAMSRARDLLAPDGLMVVKFQVENDWIASRLRLVIEQSFGRAPLETVSRIATLKQGTPGYMFLIGSESRLQSIRDNPELANHLFHGPSVRVALTTDDWPYFYQKHRGVPVAVLGLSALLLVLSVVLVGKMAPWTEAPSPLWNSHFFLLGAGFMLLEAQIVSKVALLFGTTWVVNSIVISGLLLLIVVANLVYGKWRSYPVALPYAAILIWGLLVYMIPVRSLLVPSAGFRILLTISVLCMPVLFAGLIFIRSFATVKFSGSALGWNLLGAVLGGILETTSQALGMRFLIVLAVALYMGSWVALSRVSAKEKVLTSTQTG